MATEEILDEFDQYNGASDWEEGNSIERQSSIEDDIIINETFYNGGSCDVYYRPDPGDEKAGVNAGGTVSFKKGLDPKSWDTPDGIHIDQDVAIPLRDGNTIYADIYRPSNQLTDLPVIIAWGFYGKGSGETSQDWNVMGVGKGTISNYAKFEGPDPSYWCRYGYAVANVDGRGAGESTGNVCIWGEQDGRDGADCVEWFGEQDWCTGKVSLFGNSGLAMCQYFIAAEQPKHLACIAPWEGTTDMYREFCIEGGVPWPGFTNMVMATVRTHGYIEDLGAMMEKYPLMNPYWESKIPRFENITVPAYVSAGWCHTHLRGSINGWRRIRSTSKWIRIHREFEWPDNYQRDNQADLKMFFDRYLKDIHNCWESTPRVRLQVMDVYDHDYQTARPEESFPLRRTKYTKMYLDASDMTLKTSNPADAACVKYDGNTGQAEFVYQFPEETEITGYMWLHLNVAAEDHDDADLFINIQKLDPEGNEVPVSVVGEPHPGAWGRLRISHRDLDPKLSTKFQPVVSHRIEQKLQPGEVVPVDIEISPTSRIWHAGEYLRVQIAGRYIRDENWFTPMIYTTDNVGDTGIYTGGDRESWLQIPVIPPKYQSSAVTYR